VAKLLVLFACGPLIDPESELNFPDPNCWVGSSTLGTRFLPFLAFALSRALALLILAASLH
jgi:hypothetical protein